MNYLNSIRFQYTSQHLFYHFSFYSWILIEILQYWLQKKKKGINWLRVSTSLLAWFRNSGTLQKRAAHARRARTVYHIRKEGRNSLKCLLWQLQLDLQGLAHFFGDPVDTKLINLLLPRDRTFSENKNSCLGHFSHYHVCIQNRHREGSLEAPAKTKNHHLYGHHGRANYSQKILF